jgi:hypothetical protein
VTLARRVDDETLTVTRAVVRACWLRTKMALKPFMSPGTRFVEFAASAT